MNFKIKIMAICSISILLDPSAVKASPPPPPEGWERFLDAEQVILAEIVDTNPATARVKVLKIYKGGDLENTIEINLQHLRGGPQANLHPGAKAIIFLKHTPEKTLDELKKGSATNPQVFGAPTTKPGVYDLLYQDDLFIGPALTVLDEKRQDELNLVDFLSRIYHAKDDKSKYKLIEEELAKDSSLVPRFPVLFVTTRYSFRGYVSDAQSLKTWLPVDGNMMPKSLSVTARDYLTKHISMLSEDPPLLKWVTQVIIQNDDEAAEKLLLDVVRNQSMTSAVTVSNTLLNTIFKNDTKKKHELLLALAPRMQEALDSIRGDDGIVVKPMWGYRERHVGMAHGVLAVTANLAIDLGVQDEAIKNAVETWAKKAPWEAAAMIALAKLGDDKHMDLLNESALRTRNDHLIKRLGEIGNEKTLELFSERISRGSPWGDNYEHWDFPKLGPAIVALANRLGGTAKDTAIHAYIVFLARWHMAYPSDLDPEQTRHNFYFCSTEDVLPAVHNTLSSLTGQSYDKPEEWLQWAMKPEDSHDLSVFSQGLMKDAGEFLTPEEGPFVSNDCATGKWRAPK